MQRWERDDNISAKILKQLFSFKVDSIDILVKDENYLHYF